MIDKSKSDKKLFCGVTAWVFEFAKALEVVVSANKGDEKNATTRAKAELWANNEIPFFLSIEQSIFKPFGVIGDYTYYPQSLRWSKSQAWNQRKTRAWSRSDCLPLDWNCGSPNFVWAMSTHWTGNFSFRAAPGSHLSGSFSVSYPISVSSPSKTETEIEKLPTGDGCL